MVHSRKSAQPGNKSIADFWVLQLLDHHLIYIIKSDKKKYIYEVIILIGYLNVIKTLQKIGKNKRIFKNVDRNVLHKIATKEINLSVNTTYFT